jgi:hypothetical protein
MAIRTPTGRTFPGNFTIIPSSKKWVFHAIFRQAFLSLYDEFICSLNRLVVTDEEDAKYRSSECLIASQNVFQFSRVMLCTLHAVWQPFKRDLYLLLPSKKTRTGKLIELTEVGQKWGEYQIFINEHFPLTIYDLIFILNCSLARYLYTIIQYQTCVYLTKDQCDRLHEILSEMLKPKWCKDSLSDECIHMIEMFQTSMKEKENYLAFYVRSKISISFDAMTTSPVKSMNSALKNGMGINSNSRTRKVNS